MMKVWNKETIIPLNGRWILCLNPRNGWELFRLVSLLHLTWTRNYSQIQVKTWQNLLTTRLVYPKIQQPDILLLHCQNLVNPALGKECNHHLLKTRRGWFSILLMNLERFLEVRVSTDRFLFVCFFFHWCLNVKAIVKALPVPTSFPGFSPARLAERENQNSMTGSLVQVLPEPNIMCWVYSALYSQTRARPWLFKGRIALSIG